MKTHRKAERIRMKKQRTAHEGVAFSILQCWSVQCYINIRVAVFSLWCYKFPATLPNHQAHRIYWISFQLASDIKVPVSFCAENIWLSSAPDFCRWSTIADTAAFDKPFEVKHSRRCRDITVSSDIRVFFFQRLYRLPICGLHNMIDVWKSFLVFERLT